MEAKKNPQHDVHKKSFRFFLIGLSVSVTLAIIAFEWTTVKLEPPIVEHDIPLSGYLAVLSTVPEPTSALPKVEKKHTTEKIYVENKTEESDEGEITIEVPLPDVDGLLTMPLVEPETDSVDFVVFAEYQPKPVGGYETFYEQVKKNLKYPRMAVKNDVEGKVFVEFIVDKNGNATKLKVIKGIGAGCDEEAMRVLALSKWEAGRQRGRTVNVKMVMPMMFKIQK